MPGPLPRLNEPNRYGGLSSRPISSEHPWNSVKSDAVENSAKTCDQNSLGRRATGCDADTFGLRVYSLKHVTYPFLTMPL